MWACLILLWQSHTSHCLLQAKAFSRTIQICELQPVCGLLHMHCKSAVLSSYQHALILRKVPSLSSEMLQKVQQAFECDGVTLAEWLQEWAGGVFFKCMISEGFIFCKGKWFLFSQKCPDWIQPSCSVGMELFALCQSGKCVNLTTYLPLVLRFRISEAMSVQPLSTFMASTRNTLRYSLFWYVTWHRLVVIYHCFEATCWSYLQASGNPRRTLKVGLIGSPET